MSRDAPRAGLAPDAPGADPACWEVPRGGDTAALVAEARGLLAAATPGPWEPACAYLYHDEGRRLTETFVRVRVRGDDVSLAVAVDPTTGYPHHGNAALIAAAPELVSALADALERAEGGAMLAGQTALDMGARAGELLVERDAALARAEAAERGAALLLQGLTAAEARCRALEGVAEAAVDLQGSLAEVELPPRAAAELRQLSLLCATLDAAPAPAPEAR